MQQLTHTTYNSIHWDQGASSEEKKSSELEKELWMYGSIIWQWDLKAPNQRLLVQIKKILKETDAPCLHTWQSSGTRQEEQDEPWWGLGLTPPATQLSSSIKSSRSISLVSFMAEFKIGLLPKILHYFRKQILEETNCDHHCWWDAQLFPTRCQPNPGSNFLHWAVLQVLCERKKKIIKVCLFLFSWGRKAWEKPCENEN